jgi:tRNA-dihydrouridine synthase
MLSSRRLPHENVGHTPESLRHADEDFLVPQILGNEESSIAASVKRLIAWGASGIDINMGCPVQKALKHNYGVALMGDAAYAAEVVRMTVRHSPVPVSVKLRVGEQNEMGEFLDFVRGLERAGASWLTLHPRTATQKRRGNADWSQIRALREQLDIPLIGNGDVQVADDVVEMLHETSCDMVMVGRALTARPWLLWQVGEKWGWPAPKGRTGPAPRTPDAEGAEYGRALLRLLDLMSLYFEESLALRKFRFFVRTGHVWLPFGLRLAGDIAKGRNLEETRAQVAAFFSRPVTMSKRTDLRQ